MNVHQSTFIRSEKGKKEVVCFLMKKKKPFLK